MSRFRKSARQLSEVVPYVLLLIVGDHVNVMFPGTGPSRASSGVRLVPKSPFPSGVPEDLSMTFDGRQWNELIVPLLKDVQTTGWRGELSAGAGEVVDLLQTIYGPGGTVVEEAGSTLGTLPGSKVPQPGTLYQPEPYLEELKVKTYRLALSFGY